MADFISTQDLIDAKRDISDLGLSINTDGIITPRYGAAYDSLPKVIREMIEQKNLKLAELQTAIDTAVAAGVGAAGWYSYLVVHDNGETQKHINDYIGATWYARVGGYGVNDKARLTTGETVISTIPANTNNPNSDMTGWALANAEITIPDITSMLAIPSPSNGMRVYVKSYYVGVIGSATPYSGGGNYVYDSSLSDQNDGGSVLNGWVLQDKATIHNFGLTSYTGLDFVSTADYNLFNPKYISGTAYNNYIAYCLSKKLPAIIPPGDYVLEDGNYIAPIYGMLGDEKDVTRIFTAVSQTGVIFKYNNDEVYSVGHARILSNISIYTHRSNTLCSALEINTPTRGAILENSVIYSSGEHLNYKKVWYLKHSNCGYFGYLRSSATLAADPYTATAIVFKVNGENNNVYYDKCDIRYVKSVVRGRKAGFTTSGIGILWTNCAFEHIGECAFEIMYQNNTFDTCHFEHLGVHYGFITPANDLQKTILIYGGENTVTFTGTGNIWLGGSTPDSANFSVFNSEGRCFIKLGQYRMAKNSRPNIRLIGTVFSIRYCTVNSEIVINTEATNTNQVATHFTNDGSTLRQYAHEVSSRLDDVEKARTAMKSIQREYAGLINGSASNRSCGTVTVRLYGKSVIVRSRGRVYRFGGTAPKAAQFFDFDATWLITPDTPANALVLSLTTSAVSGTKVDGTTTLDKYTSLFGTILAADLKNGFSFPRKTNENTEAVSPFDVTYSINFSGIFSGYWATTGGYYSVIDVENEIIFTEDATSAKPNNAYINPCINRAT